MLLSLSIKNFAIIEEAQIDYSEHMTVLSGETGAGKSIIIDALGILCGGRGSTDFIRQGSDKFIVEALFSLDKSSSLWNFLLEYGWVDEDWQDDLIIHRELTLAGKNLIRINGHLANVTDLKALGYYLVDIHGQNEHQSLLDVKSHLSYLDDYADLGPALEEYQELYHNFRKLRRDYMEATTVETGQEDRLNYLEFQLDELEKLNLQAGEDTELIVESKRLENGQKVVESLQAIDQLMMAGEVSVDGMMGQVTYLIQNLASLDSTYQPFVEQATNLQIQMQDLARDIMHNQPVLDYDTDYIDRIQERLNQLEQAQKKYHKDLDELLVYQDKISEEIFQLRNREVFLAQLGDQLTAAYDLAYQAALSLRRAREQARVAMMEEIGHQLADLYMQNSRFEVRMEALGRDQELTQLMADDNHDFYDLSDTGMDSVEFYAQTNLGETFKPLAKVASGGELSRFMLALKTVFSRNKQVGTLVFDEIDTGVSGRVATAIAQKIQDISQYRQVLCISHLAQVTAAADQQLLIKKDVQDGRTYTSVQVLEIPDRLNIIASMVTGQAANASSLEIAKDMLNQFHQEGLSS